MIAKTILAAAVAAIAGVASAATSTPAGWTDDFDAAKKQAAAENKLLLVDFSGSDWCGWCKKLDREVFAKPEFLKGAKKDFVLVMVDSPNDKNLLSQKAAEQNPKLVNKYNVHGFPTVLIMDSDGTVLDKTGYRDGGPEKYLEHLAEIKKFSTTITTLKRDIAGLDKGNPARLAKIDAAFADADEETLKKNLAFINELLDNDPDGKYAAKYPFVKLDKKLDTLFGDLNKRFRKRLKEVAGDAKRPSREQIEQVESELDGYAIESMRKLLKETKKEQAAAPEHAKMEYSRFVERLNSILQNIEKRSKKSGKSK